MPAANAPLIFAAPADLSFGLVRIGTQATRSVTITDAGGGAGPWTAAVALQGGPSGVTVTVPPTVTVPGPLDVTVAATTAAPEADVTGFVVLTLGSAVRRIPFWFRVESPKLGGDPVTALTAPGLHTGQMRGKRSLVSSYRYPADPQSVPGAAGPEQVFRVRITRPVANFGVVLVKSAGSARSRPSPRVVAAGNENRLTGNAGLPLVINPYLDSFGTSRPVAGAIRPGPGTYDVVFDTPLRAPAAGRVHVPVLGQRRHPADRAAADARIAKPARSCGSPSTDAGSGVDPQSLAATIDGRSAAVDLLGDGRATVSLPGVAAGRHRVVLDGRGLPGAEEHGERAADPPEHQDALGDVHGPLAARSCSSIVGSRSRSRWTLAANSSLSSRISRSWAFWAARARFCREREPRRPESRGHSAARSTITAAASRAMKSQLTWAL